MEQYALTLILPIANAENADWLDKKLTYIGTQLGNNPEIDFNKSKLTHFARFVILPSAYADGSAKRLLFTSNYDGGPELYARELISTGIATVVDTIFSKCGGYTAGTLLTESSAVAFLTQQNIKSNAFYIALRGVTRDMIEKSAAERMRLDALADTDTISDADRAAAASLYKEYEEQRAKVSSSIPPQPVSKGFWAKVLNVVNVVLEWLVGIRYDGNNPQISVKTQPDLWNMEDLLTQNQLTVVVPIKKNLLSRIIIHSILWLISIQVKYVKGTLLDLTTIHFARWVIIDNGNNILFESNFDGSWENYIDDFVDHASVGMNVIWGNCIGFPRGGAKDIESFKAYIRENQNRTQLYFSAYKDTTVSNILTDLSISKLAPELTWADGEANFVLGYYGA